MTIVVQKYGGSSVANLDKIQAVAEQIIERKRQGVSTVVVVSAMGNSTNELLGMARQLTPNPSVRELDMLVTVGERISMSLLSIAIQARGEAAISFTGSQSGIITTNDHQGAKVVEVRPHRIRHSVEQGNIVIVAGYQGVSRAGEVTTLGRGGSDTSAVALAASLEAEACEIYSDVDGVYTADPKLCADARHIEHVSYEMMVALSNAGAKVLSAEAIELAQEKGVLIRAGKTGDARGRYTVVSDSAANVPGVVGLTRVVRAPSNIPGARLLFACAEGHVRDVKDCPVVPDDLVISGVVSVVGGQVGSELLSDLDVQDESHDGLRHSWFLPSDRVAPAANRLHQALFS